MSSEIKILVLDLDGTLARTEHLHSGRRVPYDILKDSPPEFRTSPLLYRQEFKWELNLLIEQGVWVVVITRAPAAYASTLLQLLGIDYSECYPHSTKLPRPSAKIEHIGDIYEVHNSNILYIGDSPEDEEEARIAGCLFEYPYWARNAINPEEYEESSRYSALISKHFSEAGTEPRSWKLEKLEDIRDSLAKGNITLDPKSLHLQGNINEYHGPQLFEAPFIGEEYFQPVFNPRIMSKWDYENDSDYFESLMEIIKLIFIPVKLVPGHHNYRNNLLGKMEISAFTGYLNTFLGESLWRHCKDWRGGASGPEVFLHLLELPALVMSAFLEPQTILIPAPSSTFSPNKPGEVSIRLAERIAQVRRINVLKIFEKLEIGDLKMRDVSFIPSGEFYCLIDDQLTNGGTIESCFEKLPAEIQNDLSLIVWSYSDTGRRWVAAPVLDY